MTETSIHKMTHLKSTHQNNFFLYSCTGYENIRLKSTTVVLFRRSNWLYDRCYTTYLLSIHTTLYDFKRVAVVQVSIRNYHFQLSLPTQQKISLISIHFTYPSWILKDMFLLNGRRLKVNLCKSISNFYRSMSRLKFKLCS